MRCGNIGLAAWLVMLLLSTGAALGQTAGTISRMGFGARGLALGNALAADVSGEASPAYNPALAPYIADQSLGLSAALLSMDRQFQVVELRTPLRPLAGISAGLVHAGVRNIDQRDGSGYHIGMASTSEYAFFSAFGLRLGRRVSIGVGLQLFRHRLHVEIPTAQSIGLDFGASVRIVDGVHVGVVADDLLARYTWDTSAFAGGSGTTSDPFPRRLRMGLAWHAARYRLRVFAEYESRFSIREIRQPTVELTSTGPVELFETTELTLEESRIRLGAEYRLASVIAVRAGLGRMEDLGRGGPRPSGGFALEHALGLLVTRVSYAFALDPWALGGTHLITLQILL